MIGGLREQAKQSTDGTVGLYMTYDMDEQCRKPRDEQLPLSAFIPENGALLAIPEMDPKEESLV